MSKVSAAPASSSYGKIEYGKNVNEQDDELFFEQLDKQVQRFTSHPWEKQETEQAIKTLIFKTTYGKLVKENEILLSIIVDYYPKNKFCIDVLYRLAEIDEINKNPSAAIDKLYKIVDTFPTEDVSERILTKIVDLHLELGEISGAVNIYQKIANDFPGSKIAGLAFLHAGALCEYKSKNYPMALDFYVKYLSGYTHLRSSISAAPRSRAGYNIDYYAATITYGSGGTPRQVSEFSITSKMLHHIANLIRNKMGDQSAFITIYAGNIKIEEFTRLGVNFIYDQRGVLQTVVPGKLEIINASDDLRGMCWEITPKPENEIDLRAIYPSGLEVIFLNAEKTIHLNQYVYEAIEFMPREFFKELDSIVFSSKNDLEAEGRYTHIEDKFTIIVYPGKIGKTNILVHELLHHWDLYLAKDESRGIRYPFYVERPKWLWGRDDPSEVYYKINWDFKTVIARQRSFPAFLKYRVRKRELEGIQHIRCDTNNIYARNENDYCQDFAFFGECFALHRPGVWKFTKDRMERGEFEFAAKYLFMKYATPFYELNLPSEESNPANKFTEYVIIRDQLTSAIKARKKIPASTIEVIDEIGKKYVLDKYKEYKKAQRP